MREAPCRSRRLRGLASALRAGVVAVALGCSASPKTGGAEPVRSGVAVASPAQAQAVGPKTATPAAQQRAARPIETKLSGSRADAPAQGEPPAAPTPVAPVAPAAPEAPNEVEKALAYDPKDPLGNLEAADALDRMASAPTANLDVKPPHHGCAVIDPGRRIWPASGPAAIAAVGRDFVVAGYATRGGHEQLFLVHVTDQGKAEPIAAFEIKPAHVRPPTAPPGLAARDENDLVVAFVDGDGKLFARKLRVARGGTGAPVEVGSGVDVRFAPALATSLDRTFLAYTVGSTPMHTQLLVLSTEAKVLDRRDITPTSLGAAAPSFVSGANPPVLVAIDPHEGVSPILRVDMGSRGDPQPTQVALPVGMVSAPPRLAAASSSIGTYVGYTGLGSAATSAIGLVAIAPIAGSPQALVKGTAYGPLHVAAAAAPRAVLFAADAPLQPGKDPEHEIHVHVVTGSGPGPAASVHAEGGVSHAALARSSSGVVGLAFTTAGGVHLARLRCDDGG